MSSHSNRFPIPLLIVIVCFLPTNVRLPGSLKLYGRALSRTFGTLSNFKNAEDSVCKRITSCTKATRTAIYNIIGPLRVSDVNNQTLIIEARALRKDDFFWIVSCRPNISPLSEGGPHFPETSQFSYWQFTSLPAEFPYPTALTTPVKFFSKLNLFIFGYFDPVHIFSDNKNKYFSGWPNRYFG